MLNAARQHLYCFSTAEMICLSWLIQVDLLLMIDAGNEVPRYLIVIAV
jgi:hypothetical protein